jgi:hypothetical protein
MLDAFQNEEIGPIVYVTLYYGLRKSEALGLRWQAVDFDANTITINHTVVGNGHIVRKDTTKTYTSRRTYELLPDVKALLLKLKYFVWVAGDRHPFQSGLKITAKEKKVFNPFTSYWKAIFCDEIDEMREALTGLDLDNSKGIRQENDYICICEISDGDSIEDKYLQAIE